MKQLWDFMILLQPDLEAAATDFGRDPWVAAALE